jgi:hypothetical protein
LQPREQADQTQQQRGIERPNHQPDTPALNHPAQHVELHRDEVLRLVLLANEGLVDLGESTLDGIDQPEQHHNIPGMSRVQVSGKPSDSAH